MRPKKKSKTEQPQAREILWSGAPSVTMEAAVNHAFVHHIQYKNKIVNDDTPPQKNRGVKIRRLICVFNNHVYIYELYACASIYALNQEH